MSGSRSGAWRSAIRLLVVAGLIALSLASQPPVAAQTVPPDEGPAIDVWYGDTQRFGHIGQAQQWANILGNVSDPDGINSLSYRLNGGASVPLSVSCCQPGSYGRLVNPGDFNADIDVDLLAAGENSVEFTAVDGLSNTSTRTVSVVYTPATVWPLPYTVDWSAASTIEDVAQITDGKWSLGPDGIRTVEPGYDRLVAIGDVTWTDYVVTVPITLHQVLEDGAGLGVLMRWLGHTDDPRPNKQPKHGWEPNGKIGWWRWSSATAPAELQFDGGGGYTVFDPVVGLEYQFKIQVESLPDGGSRYSMKAWPTIDPEPADWMLVRDEPVGNLANGSFLLLAHQVDATFGDVTVGPISPPPPGTWVLSTSVVGDGSVVVDPVKSVYDDGDVVTLTATPGAGSSFVEWSGDVSGSSNPVSVTMSADRSVTATFAPDAGNGAPQTGDDSYTTPPDTALVVDAASGLLANDSDPESEALAAELARGIGSGSLTVSSDGAFSFYPAAGFTGVETFTYLAVDPVGNRTPGSVTIVVGEPDAAPRFSSGSLGFAKDTIDTTVEQTHAVVGADFDDDGDVDLAATDFVAGEVVGYENDGSGAFSPFVVDGALGGAYPLSSADVDGDGSIDLLAGGYDSDTVAWYANDGAGGFVRQTVDVGANGVHSVLAADVDTDGDMDLVTSEQDGNSIAWYENDGTQSFTKRVIDSTAEGAKRAEVGDLDGDGDVDIVAALAIAGEFVWYENDGSQSFVKRLIGDGVYQAYYTATADLDADGDLDVLRAGRFDDTVAWYRNDGGGVFTFRHVATLDGARSAFPADVDGDGDPDIVSTGADDDTVGLHLNDGSGNFTPEAVDTAADGAYGAYVIDVDGDGDRDVLSASRDANAVAVHEQRRLHSVWVEVGTELLLDSSRLRATDVDDPASALTYRLEQGPSSGELRIDGLAIPVGSVFTQQDVDDGRLSYAHLGSVAGTDGFQVSLTDGAPGRAPALASFDLSITDMSPTWVLSTSVVGDGSVVVDPVKSVYDDGDVVSLMAVPGVGSSFVGWSGDVSGSSNPVLVTMSADTSVTATFTPDDPPPGGVSPVSDGFSGSSLGSLWSVVDPLGDGSVSVSGGSLSLSVPAGTRHDVWSSNDALRVMQPTDDVDFEIEVKFDSLVDARYQLQGLLIEQDASNYLRFDFYGDGVDTKVFAMRRINGGSPSILFNATAVSGTAAPLWMRVSRSGDQWSQSWSSDGVSWSQAASFPQPLAVSSSGVFAGNAGSNPAHTAVIDYFDNTAAPSDGDPPPSTWVLSTSVVGDGSVVVDPVKSVYDDGDVVSLMAVPGVGSSFVGWSGDVSGSSNPVLVTMSADTSVAATFTPDDPPPSTWVLSTSVVGDGSVVVDPVKSVYDDGDVVSLMAVPGVGSSFVGWSGDVSGSSNPVLVTMSADTSVTATFTPDDPPPGGVSPVSDGFSGSSLGSLWSVVDPLGDGSVSVSGGSLSLSVPAGTRHDVWSSNDALRVMQPTDDVDFEIEVKFDSLVDARYQLQGLLIEQDASNYLRFDFYGDGVDTKVFAMRRINGGSPSILFNATAVSGTAAPLWMRVSRSGDQWSQSWSSDGVSWSQAASFPQPLAVSSSGVFAGNAGSNPAHTAVIDYFDNTAAPSDGDPPPSTWVLSTSVVGDGSVVVDPVKSVYDDGDVVSLMAVPGVGSSFVGWSGDVSGSSNPVLVTMSADTSVAATFTPDDPPPSTWVLSTSVVGDGSVVVDPVKSVYDDGDVVSLMAVPGVGSSFVGWSGDVSGSSNPVLVTMSADTSVAATFTPDDPPPSTWVLSTSVVGDGSVVVDPVKSVYDDGDVVSLMAVPGVGSSFVGWSGDVSGSSNPVLVTMSADTSVTATFTPDDPPPGGVSPVSDGFSGSSLGSLWSVVDPLGDGSVSVSGGSLSLSVPAGTRHDVWSSNDALRVMQPTDDVDFEIEVKFDSLVDARYQLQGLLIEQDASNYLRFDFYGDGVDTKVFAMRRINGGSPSILFNATAVSGTAAPLWMRVSRSGDQWSQSWSSDGVSWSQAASFPQPLAVSSSGVFAGNAGSNPAHTAVIDYFDNTAAPSDGDPPPSTWVLSTSVVGDGSVVVDPVKSVYDDGDVVSLMAVPGVGSSFVGWSGDVSGSSNPVLVTMSADTSVAATFTPDDPPPSTWVLSTSVVGDGSVVVDPVKSVYDDGDVVSLMAVPGVGSSFVGWSGDVSGSSNPVLVTMSADTSVTATFTPDDPPPGGVSPVSDGFSGSSLGSLWSVVDPLGDGSVSVSGGSLSLSVPAGTRHDVWSSNDALRVMQPTDDVDFEIEVKFDSLVDARYQLQGLLIEQDASNYLRFDFYGDGVDTKVFAMRRINGGSPSILFNATAVSGTAAPLWMRVSRSGDQWSQSWSSDGVSWSQAASFPQPLAVSSSGVFAGNAGSNPAHTAVIDYFDNTAAPS